MRSLSRRSKMLSLIIGGCASGKSAYAEDYVSRLPGEKIYLATMTRSGKESLEKIEKHQYNRRGKGFETIECPCGLKKLWLPPDANVLLECLGNLAANELFMPEGGGEEALLEGLFHLQENCLNLTVVANEVFSGGADYEGETLHYMQVLGRAVCLLSAKADYVCEVVCSLPNVLKMGEMSDTGDGKEKR